MKNSDKKIEEVILDDIIECPGCPEDLEANRPIENDPLGIKELFSDERSRSDAGSHSTSSQEHKVFLPPFNIMKIMRSAKSGSGKISKQSKEFMQECVTEFILCVTSAANEYCCEDDRKILNGEDILRALGSLGFDNYVEPLADYLQKYRDMKKEERDKARETRKLQQAEAMFNENLIIYEHEMYRYSTVVEDSCEDEKFFSDLESSND